MEDELICDLVGGAHGCGVCYDFHWFVEDGDGYFEGGVAFFIEWEVFFSAYQHVVVAGAAPFDSGICLAVSYEKTGGGAYGGSSGSDRKVSY